MEIFIDDDFLLTKETSKKLYHQYAANMPIIDYHSHLSPREIFENTHYDNITKLWLGGDHYKWRLMRSCGIEERYITGDASDKDKFLAFSKILPYAIGNPVYHWTHLELLRYFHCKLSLNSQTAEEIWTHCNNIIQNDSEFCTRGIIESSGVETLCTTDDPADDLIWHKKLKEEGNFKVNVYPAFRPDAVINIEKEKYPQYISKLSQVSKIQIIDFSDLLEALKSRIDYFATLGCKASDHGIKSIDYAPADESEVANIFSKRLKNIELDDNDLKKFKYFMMVFLAKQYAKKNWVMEIHFGAERDVNSKGFLKMGPDTGYDTISAENGMTGLHQLLNELNTEGSLPKTILFSLNPTDNAVIAALCGCFYEEGIKGKVQQGSAWWFNDSIQGMRQQMSTFANMSVLSNFVGMLTDSRSFLSYPRHEYFRRILCDMFGKLIEDRQYPNDIPFVGEIVKDICYRNASEFFRFNKNKS